MKTDSNADLTGLTLYGAWYFDTPADKALMEKIDGVDNREKSVSVCIIMMIRL